MCTRAQSLQASLTLCHHVDYSSPGSSIHGFPGKNAGVGCHFPLWGILPTQGLNPPLLYLLHCRWALYPLSHLGSPTSVYIILLSGHRAKNVYLGQELTHTLNSGLSSHLVIVFVAALMPVPSDPSVTLLRRFPRVLFETDSSG